MRVRRKTAALLGAALLVGASGAIASADDGYRVSKSMSHEGQDTGGLPENEHAFITTMNFYVPMQQANGSTTFEDPLKDPTLYYNVDEELVGEPRLLAKPLVGVYINGEVEHVDGVGFAGYGKRDAYGAISLDDGQTWKNTNLSESADSSSSDVIRSDIPLFSDTEFEYPGDVVNIFHAVAGENVVVAWPSRFCSMGQPNYSLDSDEAIERRAAIAAYLGIDLETASADDLYLVDMYRVAGQQGSVDYAEDKWEQNHVVGEVPFNCLWTARGKLVQGDDPRTEEAVEETYMRWFKAERLTSGRRDVNRVEVKGVEGAGFAITWQEDPKGLRPGQGEGPGAGWSGAIANNQTDVWYSYIDWENFDVVQDPYDETGVTPMLFADYTAESVNDITQKPKVFVPFAMPMPITDNAKCNVENPAPYCYGSALNGVVEAPTDSLGNVLDPIEYGMKDMCATTVEVPTGHNDTPTPVCIPEYADGSQGVPLVGNTAVTRARLGLFGYDSDGDGATDSAYVVAQMEEDKGLGRALFLPELDAEGVPTGLPSTELCPADADEKDCVAWDQGKNQWYHTFKMSLPDESAVAADDPVDGLLANLTFHGHMLNQPEIAWHSGEFIPTLDTSLDVGGGGLGYGEFGFELHNTEIARRGSMLAQSITAAQSSENKLVALPTWKQGQMNQGGPADVMSRRIVIPDAWTPADGNPYAFDNMVCDGDMLYTDGSNPYYPGGLCLAPAINMSATIPDTAVDSADPAADVTLPTITDGASDVNPFLRGLVQGEGDTTKVLTWHQGPLAATVVSQTDGMDPAPVGTETESTFDDQSWYNPYEVAKGHRGFLDGDFVMMLYAWSPNWRLNSVGHDRYELYIRRSFDGAGSWTTTPGSYDGDGTVACETYRTSDQQQQGDSTEPRVCYEYTAGGDEQARNVTQHSSMRTTTLDPRYAKTPATITADPFGYGVPNYDLGSGSEDVRDPSRFFIVYETGDNTTTAEGEPEPLDLFYSRGVNFGDDYQVWAEDDYTGTTEGECYPSDPHDDEKVPLELIDSGFCNEFDQLEQGKPGLEASEASLAANPGGEFLYAAWAQMVVDNDYEELLATADALEAAAAVAQAEADAAQLTADELQVVADKAEAKADRAQDRADRFQRLADRAQARADRVQDRADKKGTDRAQDRADRFQRLADRAEARADRFQDRADGFGVAADAAQATADAAQATADAAQTAADEALSAAIAARAAAEEALAELGESDAMVRRVWWIDDYISETDAWVMGQGPSGS